MKINAIILTKNTTDADRVYTNQIRLQLSQKYNLHSVVLNKNNLNENKEAAIGCEYIFSTWGMEHFTKEEIKKYFPNVKCLFYAAGSVQGFAKEFLECGIRVYSAWRANAIPVAEYTYAQIILATKGFYRAERKARWLFHSSAVYAGKCGGNYAAKIGIIGVGGIGSLVAKKLMANDVEVYYYDPFLSSEAASSLGIKKASLEELFSSCDVITNHLANKEELKGVLSVKLFASMKPFATFINTGRGGQVDEKGLALAMKKIKTRTAVLDVTSKEPIPPLGRLARRKNIIITPHIAGSIGREVVRMAQYMIDEAEREQNGEQPLHEVTMEMLATMA